MSDTMSGTPPEAPTPDPRPDSDSDSDDEEDEKGLLEFYKVIKVKMLPEAFKQGGITRHSETTLISRGQGLRRVESCKDPDDKSTSPRPKIKTPELEIQKILMWESYVQYYAICNNGKTTTPSDTSNATFREHSTLHLKDDPHEYVPGTTAPATVMGPSKTAQSPSSMRPLPHPPRAVTTLAGDSQRGVKRDIAHYEEPKRDDQWDEWSRTFVATINTHGCKNVIDPNYIPGTAEARELFDSQQEFVCTIFIKALKTDYGRSLIRRHEATLDSQRIWEALKLYYTDSMISVHRAQQLKVTVCCFPSMSRFATHGSYGFGRMAGWSLDAQPLAGNQWVMFPFPTRRKEARRRPRHNHHLRRRGRHRSSSHETKHSSVSLSPPNSFSRRCCLLSVVRSSVRDFRIINIEACRRSSI